MAGPPPSRDPVVRPSTGFQRDLERRRVDIARKQNQQAVPYIVSGIVRAFGSGETTSPVPIGFPVTFVGRPSFTSAGDYVSGIIGTGTVPTVNAVVAGWNIRADSPTFDPANETVLIFGASLHIVVNGDSSLVMDVHWQVVGVALRRMGGIDEQI